jgi:hypothetical protein
MQELLKPWLLTVFALWTVTAVDKWLPRSDVSIYGQLAWIVALATLATWHWRKHKHTLQPPVSAQDPAVISVRQPQEHASQHDGLLREVALAIEHIRSIRILLDISQAHQQPIPRAVPGNLDLVLKHLLKAQEQFSVEPTVESVDVRTKVSQTPHLRLSRTLATRD